MQVALPYFLSFHRESGEVAISKKENDAFAIGDRRGRGVVTALVNLDFVSLPIREIACADRAFPELRPCTPIEAQTEEFLRFQVGGGDKNVVLPDNGGTGGGTR